MADGIESKLFLTEEVENTERTFGSQKTYFPLKIQNEDGEISVALFTKDQIDVAIERAGRNPEDIPEDKTFWQSLFG
jgi:hypothetical protein